MLFERGEICLSSVFARRFLIQLTRRLKAGETATFRRALGNNINGNLQWRSGRLLKELEIWFASILSDGRSSEQLKERNDHNDCFVQANGTESLTRRNRKVGK